jgi:tRNA-2-methylthio-N6-dimethylallyladenosine synthase
MNKYYHILTYGCQMNIHESEKIAGMLDALGYQNTQEKANADVIVFNTCCIRDTAETKIMGNIGEIKRLKKINNDLIVAVVGCMTQQKGTAESLREKFPFINIMLGTDNLQELPNFIKLLENDKKKHHKNINLDPSLPICETIPKYRTSGTNAWVNIMYGCNNFCSYCIVPYVRGRERSREPKLIIDEVKSLVDSGYKEITLLGQNVDSYRFENYDFAYILEQCARIDTKFRLRFMTSHPKDFNTDIVDIIRSHDNICNNIHLPVQSGSNRILKLMNRKYTREHYLELIDEIKTLPNVGITSDIMVGFPTETDEDFADTLDLVKKVRYSSAFTFVYSPRKGTQAAIMEQLPAEIKKERIQELVKLQNSISAEVSKEYIGKSFEVLVEDINHKYENSVCGRTESGRLVTFAGDKSLIGEFVNIRITKTRTASLLGEIDG